MALSPSTFLPLRGFLAVLSAELEEQLGQDTPCQALLLQIAELQLPTAPPTGGQTGAELGPLDVIGFTDLHIALDGHRLVVDGTLDTIAGYEPAIPVPGLPKA